MKKLIIHNVIHDDENPIQSLNESGLANLLKYSKIKTIKTIDLKLEFNNEVRDRNTNILGVESWKIFSWKLAKCLEVANYDNEFHCVIGGDCSNLLGIMGSFCLKKIDVGLVMLDGHTDYRLPIDSPTGDPADMETAIITGSGSIEVTNMFGKIPILDEKSLLLLGVRELDHVSKSNIKYITAEKLEDVDISKLIYSELENLFLNQKLVWLHIDVDVLEPKQMPVNYPIPNGLSYDEVLSIVIAVCNATEVIGCSIGCYHPVLDETGLPSKQLALLLSKVILEAIEKRIN